jgi:hypothetical protein
MIPKINWLLEQRKAEVIKMVRLSTEERPVDIGTKHSTGTEWNKKVDRTMGR